MRFARQCGARVWAALRPLARDTEPTAEGEASLVPLVSLSSSSSHRTKPSRAVPEDDDIRSTRAEPQESKLKEIRPCETNEKRIFEGVEGRFRRNREKEREREPLSWHPAQRVQNDAEAGRGEPSRTAPRRGGGGSAGPVVGGGGSIEWEDWARGPRRARGGGRPVCPSSTRPVAFFPGGGRGEGRGEVEEEEERHGGRVGRPTTPPGACPESARILYRARLITSRGVPRWFTAANFSADRPNHRPLTHFCALVLPERTLGLHGRTIVVKVKRSRIISLENNYC